MRSVYRSNLFALILILGQILGSVFLSKFLYRNFNLQQVLVLAQILFLMVPTIIYFAATRLPVRETLKLNRISLSDIGLIIAIAVLSQPVASFLSALTNMFFRNIVNEVFKDINNISYLVQLGVVALTPAIFEEITMRGVVLSGYKNISNFKAALMTGLIFGILHLNPQQFLYAFILGIMFAYLVRITNSIFSSMLCHFTFNGIQMTLAYVIARSKPDAFKNTPDFVTMSAADKLSTILPLFFSALFFGIIVIFLIRRLDKSNRRRRMGMAEARIKIEPSFELERNMEMGYPLSEGENGAEESVVNAPFMTTVLVAIVFMILIEFVAKR